ncbi:MAG: hypothetical protein HYY49_12750 [Ignavibacteriales bacterium]|nr:hypothetical protein [Ignavibacteriales bacterium]
MKISTFLIVAVTLLVSCSKQTETATKDTEEAKSEKPRIRLSMDGMISVGKCRLIGTVVSIDNQMMSPDTKSPCAQAPCRAIVRVDSILGYGSGFGAPLAVGQEMPMHFAFTLNSTKELFKDMAVQLPGLKVGSRFQADVGGTGSEERGSDARATVSIYKVME